MNDRTWQDMFPEGRHIFYEGDDPHDWIDRIRRDFGLDPHRFEVAQWRDDEIVCLYRVPDPAGFIRSRLMPSDFPEEFSDGFTEDSYTVAIDCPPKILDEIYTSDEYGPMGS